MIRVLLLALRLTRAYPDQPIDRAVVASYWAVQAETASVPAEVLLAIAEHESDLRPDAVSWVAGGRRHDSPPEKLPARLPTRVVCGYLSAMGTPDLCRRESAIDGGMRLGALELGLWSATCRGDIACVLRGHASGTACALDAARCSDNAAAFARLFLARARRLGYSFRYSATSRSRSAREHPIASGS